VKGSGKTQNVVYKIMTELQQHELQNPQGEPFSLQTIMSERPTLFVLLRHFG
jgi:hypothetical protein